MRLAAWVIAEHNNEGLPFVIVSKTDAKVFAMNAEGQLVGAAPALLGLAIGDDSDPGIGARKLADIGVQQRITPAGRFVASMGRDLAGQAVLWLDYADALALHPVATTNPLEQRLRRLSSPSASDNRISYGCINVPESFFNGIVRPLFDAAGGVVYVLPETRSLSAVFPIRQTSPAVAAQVQVAAAHDPVPRPVLSR